MLNFATAYKVMSYATWKAIRRAHAMYSPERKQALENAKVIQPVVKANGEVGKKYLVFYRCADCSNLFKKTEVDCDHIDPVGPYPRHPDDFMNGYFKKWYFKLHCPAEGYQILCKPCHKLKTKKGK